MSNQTSYYKNRLKRQNERLNAENERREELKKKGVILLGGAALAGATAFGMHKTMELEQAPQAPASSETSQLELEQPTNLILDEQPVQVENPANMSPSIEIPVADAYTTPPVDQDNALPPHPPEIFE